MVPPTPLFVNGTTDTSGASSSSSSLTTSEWHTSWQDRLFALVRLPVCIASLSVGFTDASLIECRHVRLSAQDLLAVGLFDASLFKVMGVPDGKAVLEAEINAAREKSGGSYQSNPSAVAGDTEEAKPYTIVICSLAGAAPHSQQPAVVRPPNLRTSIYSISHEFLEELPSTLFFDPTASDWYLQVASNQQDYYHEQQNSAMGDAGTNEVLGSEAIVAGRAGDMKNTSTVLEPRIFPRATFVSWLHVAPPRGFPR